MADAERRAAEAEGKNDEIADQFAGMTPESHCFAGLARFQLLLQRRLLKMKNSYSNLEN